MARLSTHVLDTSRGRPAVGIRVRLFVCEGDARRLLRDVLTNDEGRTDHALLSGSHLVPGVYELLFSVAEHFGTGGQGSPFLDEVVVRFGISNPEEDYHVPLLIAPYGYSTYRGS